MQRGRARGHGFRGRGPNRGAGRTQQGSQEDAADFLQQVIAPLPGHKVVTLCLHEGSGGLCEVQFHMDGGEIVTTNGRRVMRMLGRAFGTGAIYCSVIVRCILDGPINPASGHPPMQVMSFAVVGGIVYPLTAQETQAASCLDSATGEQLEPEPGVEYI